MTTFLDNYQDPIYSTNYADEYNGTVYISAGEYSGTGTLLHDGRTILTAAHVVEGSNRATVSIDTANGSVNIDGNVTVHESYDSQLVNNDVAIITLDTHAPVQNTRYELYRDSDELGQDFTMVGYGSYGSGRSGELIYEMNILKLKTENTFEVDFHDVDNQTLENSVLGADFDDGTSITDEFGWEFNINHTGVGDMEGMIAGGDSGGPAFLDGKVAGIASFSYGSFSDIDFFINSTFGELGGWQRVSYFQEWIDTNMRENYENTPSSIQGTGTRVEELDTNNISTTYFYLQFDRGNITSDVTLQYTTRDGSATAGEDYIAKSGSVTLYANENSVVIPVEIIGDNQAEGDEIFYLDITAPSYGTFNGNLDTLIASRVISDDEAPNQNTINTTFTYFTTQNYVEDTFGLTMQTAADAIMASLSNIETLYTIFVQNNINNDMIADVLQSEISGVSGDDVSLYLTANNLDGAALGTYYDDTYFIA